MKDEYPNVEAIDHNRKYGYSQEYQLQYTYACNIWDLYRNYLPLLIGRMDDESNFKVDNKPIEIIGRWQNSSGLFVMSNFAGEKNPSDKRAVEVQAPVHSHFAYIKLPKKMVEGSTHKVSFMGYEHEFTYGSERYCSSIKVNQVGYSTESTRWYAYWGQWIGIKNDNTASPTFAFSSTTGALETKLLLTVFT
jgi:hypothetical protein